MGTDHAGAADSMSVGVAAPLHDGAFGTTRWRIERWDERQTNQAMHRLVDLGAGLPSEQRLAADGHTDYSLIITPDIFAELDIPPCDVSEFDGNLITNAGWTRLMNLLTAQGGTQALSSTATRIGVGNSNTTETSTDTDLGAAAGSANRWFQPVSASGTLGTRTVQFAATFGTADGNFAWNETGLDVGTPTVTSSATVNALLFNHKAGIAQGTKASGQTWTATATLTFT